MALLATAIAFSTEAYFDYIEIGDTQYSGSVGPSNVAMTAGQTLRWYTDGSVTDGGGFTICGSFPSTTTPMEPSLPAPSTFVTTSVLSISRADLIGWSPVSIVNTITSAATDGNPFSRVDLRLEIQTGIYFPLPAGVSAAQMASAMQTDFCGTMPECIVEPRTSRRRRRQLQTTPSQPSSFMATWAVDMSSNSLPTSPHGRNLDETNLASILGVAAFPSHSASYDTPDLIVYVAVIDEGTASSTRASEHVTAQLGMPNAIASSLGISLALITFVSTPNTVTPPMQPPMQPPPMPPPQPPPMPPPQASEAAAGSTMIGVVIAGAVAFLILIVGTGTFCLYRRSRLLRKGIKEGHTAHMESGSTAKDSTASSSSTVEMTSSVLAAQPTTASKYESSAPPEPLAPSAPAAARPAAPLPVLPETPPLEPDATRPLSSTATTPPAVSSEVEMAVTAGDVVLHMASDDVTYASRRTHGDDNVASDAAAVPAAAPAPASARSASPVEETVGKAALEVVTSTASHIFERISQGFKDVGGSVSSRFSLGQPAETTTPSAPPAVSSAPLATLAEIDEAAFNERGSLAESSDMVFLAPVRSVKASSSAAVAPATALKTPDDEFHKGGSRDRAEGPASDGGGDDPPPSAEPPVRLPAKAGSLKAIPLNESDFNDCGSLVLQGDGDDDEEEKVFLTPVVVKKAEHEDLQA